MRDFLEYVAAQLVDRPEHVHLTAETRDGVQAYVLRLPASEVGKIIGKQGHTIQAIRHLIGAAVARQGGRCTFEVVGQETADN